jgi:enoyl-[acyl-carrier protein] reductase II
MIKSKVCDLLEIKYPIFQGGMAWISEAKLAGAVSNAGGLGIISAMNADADYLRKEIRKCKELTSNIFGVNIMLMSPFVDEVAQVVIDEHVPVVTTGAGVPSKYMKNWIEAKIKVIPVVPSTAIARKVESLGACAVIAEGGESGGHIGNLTTMVLVPQICDAVSIPVIAAGGIGDGRGVAAALMLGAEGVQCGTRFLSAFECSIHPNYKKRIFAAHDIGTITTGQRLGHPVRALKNPFTLKFYEMEYNSSIPDHEIEQFGAGALQKAVQDGNEKEGCFMAGQIAAIVNKEQSVQDIINEMMTEAVDILRSSKKIIN